MGGLADRILRLTGERPAKIGALHGGDLSDVSLVTLQDGGRLVAKSGPMVDREARMLTAMSDAGAPVPSVIANDGDLILMEALYEERAGDGSWAALGTILRNLHDVTGEAYGWSEDYAFGRVSIPNATSGDWPDFWAANRLLTHVNHLPGGLAPRIANLCEKLPHLLPAHPAPALLHGDLWTGNLLFGAAPSVWLIDPACYYGDREVDIAMLHLFGQPGGGFDEAYGPLDDGWEERRAVYTLWPAIVHLRLFGSGYRGLVNRLLSRLGV